MSNRQTHQIGQLKGLVLVFFSILVAETIILAVWYPTLIPFLFSILLPPAYAALFHLFQTERTEPPPFLPDPRAEYDTLEAYVSRNENSILLRASRENLREKRTPQSYYCASKPS